MLLQLKIDHERIPIEDAIDFLNQNFSGIPSIAEWAEKMGYPRSSFWRKFDMHYGEAPRAMLIEKKKRVLETFLKTHPECRFKDAAKAIHFSNGNDLYRFVKRQYNCTPTELKRRMLGE